MIRNYLTLVVVIGVFTSVLGGVLSPPSSSSDRPSTDAAAHASSDNQFIVDRSFRSTQAGSETADGSIEIDRSANGHFYADVLINGASITALVDTGASGIALSREDARKAGIALSIGMPDVIGQGADGDVRGEFVKLNSVALGGKTVENMDAMVLNSGEQSLLGQDFLSKFESVEISGDTMVLR
jgi:aspartyl protease family protein